MPGEFLDSNVLVYAFTTDPRAAAAQELLARDCVIGVQGLNEFTNVARRKLGMSWREVREALAAIRAVCRTALPVDIETHADALDDTRWDEEISAEGAEALSLTGRDVGTPVIHFSPPGGAAFFGPVISRLPGPDDAVRLWDHVTALAGFPGFAELKRSLRERPQLLSFGVQPGTAGAEDDWHAGSRKTAS